MDRTLNADALTEWECSRGYDVYGKPTHQPIRRCEVSLSCGTECETVCQMGCEVHRQTVGRSCVVKRRPS